MYAGEKVPVLTQYLMHMFFVCCVFGFIIPVQKLTSPSWLHLMFFGNVVPLYHGFQTPRLQPRFGSENSQAVKLSFFTKLIVFWKDLN
jgi:hypothetical protein